MKSIDIEITKKAINGDKTAFTEIIQERKTDIFRLAYGYMKNDNDALDILGETVYRAFVSIKKLNNPEYFNTWLTKIIINCSINALKKKNKISKTEILYFFEETNDYSDNLYDEICEDSIVSKIDLGKSIDKLKLEEKTVIMLKYFEDFTITQIAEVLSCPVGTVKTRLNRALKNLRKEII